MERIMEINYFVGILFSLLAGLGQGSFMTPMKKMTKWEWENQWVLFSVTGYLIFPFLLAIITMPNLMDIYQTVGYKLVIAQLLLGMIWGIGAVAFGVGTYYVGLALGFALILGLSSGLGAIVPIIILHPESIWAPESQAIYVGIFVILIGLSVCARAGALKEKELRAGERENIDPKQKRFMLGFLICLLSGVFSALVIIIFAYGGEKIAQVALQKGVSQSFSQNAFWTAFLPGACVTNLGYAFYLLSKNKTWSRFKIPHAADHWLLGILTGFLWMGGFALYGAGAANLGVLGPSLGWPIMVSSMIIIANIWGAVTGEWKGVSSAPIKYQLTGILFLILAIIIIGIGPSIFA